MFDISDSLPMQGRLPVAGPPAQPGEGTSRHRRRAVLAGMAGNVMEWYDFTVYGYFALVIGKQFFPSGDPLTSLISAFGAFAAGYLMRPFGSILFGHIADRYGRGRAMWLSVSAMAVPTFCIGLLPTHAQAGATAAALLVLLRMLQGFAVGGECGTSTVFLIETARPGRRGLASSWGSFGVSCGVLLGSAVGATVTGLLGEDAVMRWGWRVPFLLGALIAVVGIYLRLQVRPLDSAAPEGPRLPVVEAFTQHWRLMLRILAIGAVNSVAFYLCFIFGPNYLQQMNHFSASLALDINTVAMLVALVTIPLGGLLSDRFGRKPVMLAMSALLGLLAWPIFWLLHHVDASLALVGQILFAALVGPLAGVIPSLMAELAPRQVRVTTMSFAFNLGMAVLGGTVPMLAFYAIGHTHQALAPALLLGAAALVSLVCAWRIPETSGEVWR